MRILIVDDERQITRVLRTSLQSSGYEVTVANNGLEAFDLFRSIAPDLVITDLAMPEMGGIELTRAIRSIAETPIIILSVREQETMKVAALDEGADDYVTKPFSARELVARVHAILRRTSTHAGGQAPPVVEFANVAVDTGRREARRDGEVVALATREFDLLAFLVENQGLALSRQQLLDGVWGPDWYGDERTVDVHVRQLRKKLGTDLPLATVWGVGYRLG